eukprot:Colp12_sorted_trinity150504_noHs@13178
MKTEGAQLVSQVKGVYHFHLKNGPNNEEASWCVDLKNGSGSVSAGKPAKADCTITMSDADFLALMTGKLDAQKAFFGGKLKVSGNMGLAMKLQALQPKKKAKL